MSKIEYIEPEATLLHYTVEQGFGISQGSPNVDIGIGGWVAYEDDYGGNIK